MTITLKYPISERGPSPKMFRVYGSGFSPSSSGILRLPEPEYSIQYPDRPSCENRFANRYNLPIGGSLIGCLTVYSFRWGQG
jgi:hypothetical protein